MSKILITVVILTTCAARAHADEESDTQPSPVVPHSVNNPKLDLVRIQAELESSLREDGLPLSEMGVVPTISRTDDGLSVNLSDRDGKISKHSRNIPLPPGGHDAIVAHLAVVVRGLLAPYDNSPSNSTKQPNEKSDEHQRLERKKQLAAVATGHVPGKGDVEAPSWMRYTLYGMYGVASLGTAAVPTLVALRAEHRPNLIGPVLGGAIAFGAPIAAMAFHENGTDPRIYSALGVGGYFVGLGIGALSLGDIPSRGASPAEYLRSNTPGLSSGTHLYNYVTGGALIATGALWAREVLRRPWKCSLYRAARTYLDNPISTESTKAFEQCMKRVQQVSQWWFLAGAPLLVGGLANYALSLRYNKDNPELSQNALLSGSMMFLSAAFLFSPPPRPKRRRAIFQKPRRRRHPAGDQRLSNGERYRDPREVLTMSPAMIALTGVFLATAPKANPHGIHFDAATLQNQVELALLERGIAFDSNELSLHLEHCGEPQATRWCVLLVNASSNGADTILARRQLDHLPIAFEAAVEEIALVAEALFNQVTASAASKAPDATRLPLQSWQRRYQLLEITTHNGKGIRPEYKSASAYIRAGIGIAPSLAIPFVAADFSPRSLFFQMGGLALSIGGNLVGARHFIGSPFGDKEHRMEAALGAAGPWLGTALSLGALGHVSSARAPWFDKDLTMNQGSHTAAIVAALSFAGSGLWLGINRWRMPTCQPAFAVIETLRSEHSAAKIETLDRCLERSASFLNTYLPIAAPLVVGTLVNVGYAKSEAMPNDKIEEHSLWAAGTLLVAMTTLMIPLVKPQQGWQRYLDLSNDENSKVHIDIAPFPGGIMAHGRF